MLTSHCLPLVEANASSLVLGVSCVITVVCSILVYVVHLRGGEDHVFLQIGEAVGWIGEKGNGLMIAHVSIYVLINYVR